MFKVFILAITLAVFISCRSEQKPTTGATSAPATLDFKEIKAPIPFAGSYINETYLSSIRDQKSPRKAQEGIEECFIRIPENTLTPTSMIINFHETLTDLIPLNHNGTYELWEKQNDSLSKVRYTITIVSEDKIKIGDHTFVRTNPVMTGGQPRILEDILFKGNYELKKGEKVAFKNNGEVTGLGKYKYYAPLIDYFDAGLDIDQVGLGETRDKLTNFGFKFRKNGLDLYELKCKTFDKKEKRCVEVYFGKKAFDLSKAEVKEK
jgi:hypothetical protein